jgi:hypothetical protein
VRACLVACVIAAAAPARGDGFYLDETYGVAMGRGALSHVLAAPLYLRIAIGMRIGDFAVEPWVVSDQAVNRTGAWKGIVGGDPAPGASDLAAYGLDAKYIVPIDHRLAMYVRGGPLAADGTGALAGFAGRGFGLAGGAQITGKVRALGFLFSPLFFSKRGPLITGALTLDAGYDFFWLHDADGRDLTARVGHVAVGFAAGTDF